LRIATRRRRRRGAAAGEGRITAILVELIARVDANDHT
jgi:hypothetical protein